jgi:hypothetical protein
METRLDHHESSPRSSTDELIAMLGVITSLIQAALQETNAPVAAMVDSAHSLNKATQVIAHSLLDFSGSPARVFQDLMALHADLHARTPEASAAVQFHDRLVQSMTHVCSSLSFLAEFIARGDARNSAAEWSELRARIRGTLSMEQERTLFDALNRGESPLGRQSSAAAPLQEGANALELF